MNEEIYNDVIDPGMDNDPRTANNETETVFNLVDGMSFGITYSAEDWEKIFMKFDEIEQQIMLTRLYAYKILSIKNHEERIKYAENVISILTEYCGGLGIEEVLIYKDLREDLTECEHALAMCMDVGNILSQMKIEALMSISNHKETAAKENLNDVFNAINNLIVDDNVVEEHSVSGLIEE